MKSATIKATLLRGCAALVLGLAGAVAHAAVYTATLSGGAEQPPNGSPGTGTITVDFDIDAHTMTIDVAFSGLIGPTSIAHIHCCTAEPGTGTAPPATVTPTLPGFPAGVLAGTYSQVFDTTLASTWNAAFITANGGTTAGAETAFLAGLNEGTAYFNIHTSEFPGGEIRGFLAPIPEPATFALLMLGAPVVLLAARRRRRG